MMTIKITGTVEWRTQRSNTMPPTEYPVVSVVWGGVRTWARVDDDGDGTVLVYDDVAHAYTLHHPMTERQMRRVRSLISDAWAEQRGEEGGKAS